MTKTFFCAENCVEYTVEPCTAICAADAGDESKRQAALIVSCEYNGELFESIVFGCDMPETADAFGDMCCDYSAWESDYTVVGTAIRRNTSTSVENGGNAACLFY